MIRHQRNAGLLPIHWPSTDRGLFPRQHCRAGSARRLWGTSVLSLKACVGATKAVICVKSPFGFYFAPYSVLFQHMLVGSHLYGLGKRCSGHVPTYPAAVGMPSIGEVPHIRGLQGSPTARIPPRHCRDHNKDGSSLSMCYAFMCNLYPWSWLISSLGNEMGWYS